MCIRDRSTILSCQFDEADADNQCCSSCRKYNSQSDWNDCPPVSYTHLQIILEAARESTESHKIAWDSAIQQAIEEAKTTMGVEFVNDVEDVYKRQSQACMIF